MFQSVTSLVLLFDPFDEYFYIFRATPTILDDGTTKLCIEKEAFREELKYVV